VRAIWRARGRRRWNSETGPEFQRWLIAETRAGLPGPERGAGITLIHVTPNGDTAGTRGAALEALNFARQGWPR
jgi:glucokinase